MIYPVACSQLPEDGGLFVLAVGRDEDGYMFADYFMGFVPEDAFGGFVPGGDDAVEGFGDDGIVGRLHDSGQVGEAFGLEALGGEVGEHVDGADEFAIVVE